MKKKLLVLAISAVLANTAMAQTKPGVQSSSARVVTVSSPTTLPPIASITPTPALDVPTLQVEQLADNPLVNPFSGKLVSDEEMQRELDRKKRQTSMAEELLKQTNVANELHAATMRKNVEIAQSVTALQKEHNSQIDLRSVLETREAERLRITSNYEAELKRQADEKRKVVAEEKQRKREQAAAERNKLSPTAAAEKRRAEAAAIKAAAQLKESQAQAIAQKRVVVLPQLSSVMTVSGVKTAVMQYNGVTLRVADGEHTPFGKVRVLDNRTVSVDGKKIEITGAAGLTRFVSSDVSKEEASSAQGMAHPLSVQPTMGAPVNAYTPPVVNAPIELNATAPAPAAASGAAPTLPRLQLPPPTFNR